MAVACVQPGGPGSQLWFCQLFFPPLPFLRLRPPSPLPIALNTALASVRRGPNTGGWIQGQIGSTPAQRLVTQGKLTEARSTEEGPCSSLGDLGPTSTKPGGSRPSGKQPPRWQEQNVQRLRGQEGVWPMGGTRGGVGAGTFHRRAKAELDREVSGGWG